MNWNQTLCSGHDFESTCVALWTPCVAFGLNKQKFDALDGQLGTHWCGPSLAYCGSNVIGSLLMLTYGGCALNAVHLIASPDALRATASLGGALGTACFAGHFRRKLRTKYGINGNLNEDICTHLLCSPCALCQETSELRYQNDILNGNIDATKAPFVQVMME